MLNEQVEQEEVTNMLEALVRQLCSTGWKISFRRLRNLLPEYIF